MLKVFRVEILIKGAAFADHPAGPAGEVCDALADICKKLNPDQSPSLVEEFNRLALNEFAKATECVGFRIMDVNGNRCGSWSLGAE